MQISLTRVLAIRFEDPEAGIPMCLELAQQLEKIVGIRERIIKPTEEIVWKGEAPFEDPTVFWVINCENEEAYRNIKPTMDKIMELAHRAAWFNCLKGNIIWGLPHLTPVKSATINIYCGKKGQQDAALMHRVTGCFRTKAIKAGPPYLVKPPHYGTNPISFYGVYEASNIAELEINRGKQYADDELMGELNKIAQYLRVFGRVRNAEIVFESNS